jgi:23S rRNA (adenine-N6)-dimethyltransferase
MATIPAHTLHHTQNFLHDRRLVAYLLAQSTIWHDDLVLEIGSGRGIITEQLASRCRRVVAIEKDLVLASLLHQRFSGAPNVSIVEGDVLDIPLPATAYKVFANIPFNVTAAIVRKLTATPRGPDDCYLVVQREAADRFLGSPDATLASVLLYPWFEAAITHRFCRADFLPSPGVDVVMLRLRKRGPPLLASKDQRCFRDFVTHCFTAWRPTVLKSLGYMISHQQGLRLARALDIDPTASASQIPPELWLQLYQHLACMSAGLQMAVTGAQRRLLSQQASVQKRHRTHVSG